MSRNPILPGIERYPELEKKFKAKLRAASSRKCRKCDKGRVISTFRQHLQRRLERDKPR